MEDGFEGGSFPFSHPQGDMPGLDDYEQLRNAMVNEKLAPNLLPHKQDLVQRIKSLIESQEERIDELQSEAVSSANLVAAAVLEEELARVQWVLKEYLRVRLRKIERHAVAYIKDAKDAEDQGIDNGLLTDAERVFVEGYFIAMGRHFRSMVLNKLPEDYQSLVRSQKEEEVEDMVDRPRLDKFVFIRVLQDLGLVVIDDEGLEADMSTGELYVVRFDFVEHLLHQGLIALV